MKTSLFFLLLAAAFLFACKPSAEVKKESTAISIVQNNLEGEGQWIKLEMLAGPAHNYPLMAIWVEDEDGNYLQTLYAAESIATGIFRHGSEQEGKWAPGERRRPAALPRWGHQRGVRASDGLYIPEPSAPLADAYTGATPGSSFLLRAKLDRPAVEAVKIFVEINQSWDWNQHWTNVRYPGDEDYKSSAQPAVVYVATLDPAEPDQWKQLEAVGRSHHSGKDGLLYDDLESLTTALQIFRSLRATISGS